MTPPSDWDGPCSGRPNPHVAHQVAADTQSAIAGWYPGFAASQVAQVDAGAIVARGRTDVDDPASRLHDRTHIGVNSLDGYHSVDTGKLTTAPLFAIEAADRVLARRERKDRAGH